MADDYVCWSLVNEGAFEPRSLALCTALMRESAGIFLDVGAHLGLYTMTVGAGAGCPVISVEPNPRTFAQLSHNARLNPGVSAQLVNVGATAQPCFLNLSDEPAGLSAWTKIVGTSATERPGSIPGQRLDDILADRNADPIRVLKIDVEGHEIEAFKGLAWSGRHRPAHVIMECHPLQTDRIEFLASRGYEARTIDGAPPDGAFPTGFPEDNLHFIDTQAPRVR